MLCQVFVFPLCFAPLPGWMKCFRLALWMNYSQSWIAHLYSQGATFWAASTPAELEAGHHDSLDSFWFAYCHSYMDISLGSVGWWLLTVSTANHSFIEHNSSGKSISFKADFFKKKLGRPLVGLVRGWGGHGCRHEALEDFWECLQTTEIWVPPWAGQAGLDTPLLGEAGRCEFLGGNAFRQPNLGGFPPSWVGRGPPPPPWCKGTQHKTLSS